MKIIFECPAALKRDYAPLLKKHSQLVPSWCHRLYLDFHAEGDADTLMSVSPLVEYRKARIYVHPLALKLDPTEREAALVHELLHLQIHPLVALLRQFITTVVEEESIAFDWMSEEMRLKMEGTVEDLRHAIVGDLD